MNKCEICTRNNEPVSKYAFEEAVTKLELANRRAWILNLVLVILLVTSLCYTMWLRSQFEAVETSIVLAICATEQDGLRKDESARLRQLAST